MAAKFVCSCSLNVALTRAGAAPTDLSGAGSVETRTACADAAAAPVSARSARTAPNTAAVTNLRIMSDGVPPRP